MVFLTHLEFSFLEGLIRLCLVPRPLPQISCLARFFRDKTLGTTTIIGAVLRFFSLLRGAALQQRGAGMFGADLECKPLALGVQEVAQD